MHRLIRLADGNWIDPTIIVSVAALDGLDPVAPESRRRPMVILCGPGRGNTHTISCDTMADAETIRDDIARQCNEARSAG